VGTTFDWVVPTRTDLWRRSGSWSGCFAQLPMSFERRMRSNVIAATSSVLWKAPMPHPRPVPDDSSPTYEQRRRTVKLTQAVIDALLKARKPSVHICDCRDVSGNRF
jgi:hypothetical protein